jgi:hypothetical protein
LAVTLQRAATETKPFLRPANQFNFTVDQLLVTASKPVISSAAKKSFHVHYRDQNQPHHSTRALRLAIGLAYLA